MDGTGSTHAALGAPIYGTGKTHVWYKEHPSIALGAHIRGSGSTRVGHREHQ